MHLFMIVTPKQKTALAISLFLFAALLCQAQPTAAYLERYNAVMKRTEWFRKARFGMFIHYGAYAIPARGEWVQSNERMSAEQYRKYVDAFVPANYKPENWASLAKEAGMQYAVMTAKHHDGFCLFDSKHTDYKISQNLPGRDFVKEYVEAFRAQGLKVGLYYSLIDWHHPDYPNVGNHPMRDNKAWKNDGRNWDNYLAYMHNQIRELMTNYGKIDILWLDYSFDNYQGEKWKAKALIEMIRTLQPDIILNNRLVFNEGNSAQKRKFEGYGDFETPEMGIPETPVMDVYNNPLPWETCLTLNNNWGYTAADNEWKSAETIVHALVEVTGKNGNLLLNVGPEPQGAIPHPCQAVLKEVGAWMKNNHESIYGCGKAELEKPQWGYFTQNGKTIYAHWTNPKIGYINIKGYSDRVESVTMLHDGQKAATATAWWGNEDAGNFFINIKEPIYFTYALPDKTDMVFKMVLKK